MPYTPLKISIQEPCHEDWSKMYPVDGTTARYCESCVKNVVDFTGFTDAQMHAYVQEYPGKLCGRFRPDQLNRPLRASRKPVSNPLRVAATAAGLMLAASGCESDKTTNNTAGNSEEFIEVLMEEGIVMEPPTRGEISLEEVAEDSIVEIAIPGMVAGAPPPPPPPEVGEIEWIVGDIEIDEEVELPFLEEEIPLPPTCPPGSPDSLMSDPAKMVIPHDAMIMGLITSVPPEPTGMDLVIDSIKSILPPSPKPAIDRTQDLRPRPNTLPPHLENITLFPNPFVDKINLEIDVPQAFKLRIVLLDASGRRVFSDTWPTRPGHNSLVLSPPQRRLKGCLFYVQVTDEKGNAVTRPIIRR